MKQARFSITICSLLGPPARDRISSEECSQSSEQLRAWLAKGTVDEWLCCALTSATARHSASQGNTSHACHCQKCPVSKEQEHWLQSGTLDCIWSVLPISLLMDYLQRGNDFAAFLPWFVRVRDWEIQIQFSLARSYRVVSFAKYMAICGQIKSLLQYYNEVILSETYLADQLGYLCLH